jgi:hypothetical protein
MIVPVLPPQSLNNCVDCTIFSDCAASWVCMKKFWNSNHLRYLLHLTLEQKKVSRKVKWPLLNFWTYEKLTSDECGRQWRSEPQVVHGTIYEIRPLLKLLMNSSRWEEMKEGFIQSGLGRNQYLLGLFFQLVPLPSRIFNLLFPKYMKERGGLFHYKLSISSTITTTPF